MSAAAPHAINKHKHGRRKEDQVLRVALIIIAALAAAGTIGLCAYAGSRFTKALSSETRDFFSSGGSPVDISFYENSPHKAAVKAGKEYLAGCPFEEVSCDAVEGFKLHGLLYPSPQGDGGRVVIGFHGFKSSALSEYGPFAKRFHEMGWDLLIVDQRAHGRSGGDYCTMGIKERTDAVRWAEFAAARYPRILLHGVSMGAATVCCASGEALPPQVEGVVSDCAYASVRDIVSYQMKSIHNMPEFPIINACELFCKLKAGFDFKRFSPEEQVRKARVPILFVHGAKDQIVPAGSLRRLYDACASKKRLLEIPDANHGESIAVDPDRYFEAIRQMFGD